MYISDIPAFAPKDQQDCEVVHVGDDVHPCIGCFGCWTKTPGRCVIQDGYQNTGIKMGRADELVYVSECVYGGFSPRIKAVQDRGIAYVHPYFEIRNNEMHHKRRYDNVLKISAYLYGDTTPAERETAKSLLDAVARNLDGTVSELRFYDTAQELQEDICEK